MGAGAGAHGLAPGDRVAVIGELAGREFVGRIVLVP